MLSAKQWQKGWLAVFLLLSSCASHYGPNLDQQYVELMGPESFIQPLAPINRQASLVILPFQMPGNMSSDQGERLALLFKNIFLQKRLCQTITYRNQPFGDVEDALRQGRQAQVDYVFTGKVNYAVDGTELGGARIHVSARLLNVRTGNTQWYLDEAADAPMDYPDLRWPSRLVAALSPPPVRRSQGPPAIPVMLATIANEMADKMIAAE